MQRPPQYDISCLLPYGIRTGMIIIHTGIHHCIVFERGLETARFLKRQNKALNNAFSYFKIHASTAFLSWKVHGADYIGKIKQNPAIVQKMFNITGEVG